MKTDLSDEEVKLVVEPCHQQWSFADTAPRVPVISGKSGHENFNAATNHCAYDVTMPASV